MKAVGKKNLHLKGALKNMTKQGNVKRRSQPAVSPCVSVIIPVYQVEKFLCRCLNSLLSQTFADWEAVCVNDGAFDQSPEILAEFAQKDKRIKIITQKNQGLSAARNKGLQNALGKYVYFLDSDDAMHPQLLEFAVRAAKDHDADLVCFQYEKSDGVHYQPHVLNYQKQEMKVSTEPLFLGQRKSKWHVAFNVWSKLYKRSLLKGLTFIEGIEFEDYPHTYAVLARRPKTVLLNSALYFYTQRQNNISSKKDMAKRIQDYAKGTLFVLDLYQQKGSAKESAFLKRTFLPHMLKEQYRRCLKAKQPEKEQMLYTFALELKEISQKGWLSVFYNLLNYRTYKNLIRKVNG